MKKRRFICPQCDKDCVNAQGLGVHLRWHKQQLSSAQPAVEPVQPEPVIDPIDASVIAAIGQTTDRIRSLRAELEVLDTKQSEMRQLEAKLKILADTRERLLAAAQPETMSQKAAR